MNYHDYEVFAKENNIVTTEVEGEFGCGYACAYVYFEPESVMRKMTQLQSQLKEAEAKNKEYAAVLKELASADTFRAFEKVRKCQDA